MNRESIGGDTLVRDVVRARPGAVRVLDTFRLDWCCGGGKSLAAACSAAGASLSEVIAELARAPEGAAPELPVPSAGEPLTAILARIVETHHAFSRAEGQTLRALATKVATRHGAAHPELTRLAELVHTLFDELDAHMQREERVLFPAIEALERRTGAPMPVRRPIHVMHADHDAAGMLLEEIARLTDRFTPPASACGSWTRLYDGLRAHDADLRRHVWLENDVVFPRALALEADAARA